MEVGDHNQHLDVSKCSVPSARTGALITSRWLTGSGWDAEETDPILAPGAAHPGPAPGPVSALKAAGMVAPMVAAFS
jgi:hypothetical protein